MRFISNRPTAFVLFAMLTLPVSGSLSAQQQYPTTTEDSMTVYGAVPSDLSELPQGPDVVGLITARNYNKLQVTEEGGASTVVDLSEATEIKGSGGFLGLGRTEIAAASLLNGLPVTIQTVEWGGGLVASKIRFKNDNLETASMIRGGTAQGFAEQTAATEALRGRVGDIDQYNIKGTTDVNFETGRWNLTPAAGAQLCAAANQANAMDNALLLVVGYTDSVGSQEYNQTLSDRRAGRVVNYLQQECGWAPYRMLTPTGMAESGPLASNDTAAGKAQNRRVSVNILVSKAVDGL